MKRNLLSLGLTCSLLLTFACQKRSENQVNSDTGNIKIGVLTDLSGQNSRAGKSIRNAVEFARDEINQAGGINGRQVELILADGKGQPGQDNAALTRLISQDKVHALLTDSSSLDSLIATASAQPAKVPMISLSSSDQHGDFFFRIASLDSSQGSQMASYAANNLKALTAAIIAEQGSEYSNGLATSFEQQFSKLGGQITSKQYYLASSQSFKDQLTNIGSARPDVIYIPNHAAEAGTICKQARELGLKSVLLGADGWNSPKFFEIAGKASDGAYVTGDFSADDPAQDVRRFTSAYKKRFGDLPDQKAAVAYDAIRILADALKRAGTSDPTKLRDSLAQTVRFSGVTGIITINSDRDAVRPTLILKLQDGKIYPVFRAEV